MKFTAKYSEYSNKWFVHLQGFGQYTETYETESEAIKAANHHNKLNV